MRRSRRSLTRSEMMARVRGRDTRPEMVVRQALRSAGVGYRLQARDLPGSPDIVMRGRGVAVFVHGCFWHRHEGCRLCSTPRSNVEFWSGKFARNVQRDASAVERLVSAGWRVAVIWECETRSPDLLAAGVARVTDLMAQGRRIRRVRDPGRRR